MTVYWKYISNNGKPQLLDLEALNSFEQYLIQ